MSQEKSSPPSDDALERELQELLRDSKARTSGIWAFQIAVVFLALLGAGVVAYFLWEFNETKSSIAAIRDSSQKELNELRLKVAETEKDRIQIEKMRMEIEGELVLLKTTSRQELDLLKKKIGEIERVPQILAWVRFNGAANLDLKPIPAKSIEKQKVWVAQGSYNVKFVERTRAGYYRVHFEKPLPSPANWISITRGTIGNADLDPLLFPLEAGIAGENMSSVPLAHWVGTDLLKGRTDSYISFVVFGK